MTFAPQGRSRSVDALHRARTDRSARCGERTAARPSMTRLRAAAERSCRIAVLCIGVLLCADVSRAADEAASAPALAASAALPVASAAFLVTVTTASGEPRKRTKESSVKTLTRNCEVPVLLERSIGSAITEVIRSTRLRGPVMSISGGST